MAMLCNGTQSAPGGLIPHARIFALVALLLVCPLQTVAHAGQRIALIIGNGSYLNTSQLPNPPADAELMGRTLSQAGFEVRRLTDVGQLEMKRAMLEFGRALRGPDVEAGLFYYAGHGVQVNGENYLVPVDAQIASDDEIDLEAININDFLSVMNSSNSLINIVILDACRNNPFARSFRSVSRGLAPVDAPKGTLIAYSTAPGDVALDGEGSNSPYTLALSQAITEGRGRTVESVFKTARRNVLSETEDRQVPWETSSVTGDFYFLPDASGSTPQAQIEAAPKPAPVDPQVAMVRRFDAARQSGTASAWRDFLSEYGSDADDFYVGLARDALKGLEAPAATPAPQQVSLPPSSRTDSCYQASSSLAGGSLCVSSILDPQYGNRYGGSNLTDGDMATAWVEGVTGDGANERMLVTFPKATQLSKLAIANGYNKSASIYGKNNRLRSAVLSASNGKTIIVEFSDTGQWQSIDLSDFGQVHWITVTINSVYRGSKYRDTAISELRLQ